MAQEIVHLATPAVYGGRANIIASPFQFAFTGEDHLRIVTLNSVTGVRINVLGRFLRPGGTIVVFRSDHAISSDRTITSGLMPMEEGFLLNLVVNAIGVSTRIGQTFVMVQVTRGLAASFIVIGQLLGGYVTPEQRLSYPGSPIQSSIEGGGVLRLVQGTAPAAGAEFTETVPTGARWELVSLWTALTTVGAGTRVPWLQARSSGGLVKWQSPSPAGYPGDVTRRLSWAQGFQALEPAAHTVSTVPLPTNQQLLAGDEVMSQTTGLQAADQWSAPQLTVREWLEGS